MKNLRIEICAALLLAAANASLAQAQPAPQVPAGSAVPVTVDNFNRAESDLVMASIVKDGEEPLWGAAAAGLATAGRNWLPNLTVLI
jgi:hypothetical protein